MLDAGGRRYSGRCRPRSTKGRVQGGACAAATPNWRSRWPRPRPPRSARAAARRLGHRQRFAWSPSTGADSTSRASRDEAAEHLRFFSGQPMHPDQRGRAGAVGDVDWNFVGEARSCMSAPLSDAFIDAYLDAEWPEVGYCVGVFRMEGRGVTIVRARSKAIISPSSACRLLPLLGALARARPDGVMTSAYRRSHRRPDRAESKSPVIHGFWLEKRWARRRLSRAPRSPAPIFPIILAERRADPDWRGCNVTMPLKLDAVVLADDASDRAVAAGAANLLVPRTASCSPATPMSAASSQLLGQRSRSGARCGGVTLLGNGGAARAVLVALALARASTT